MLSKLKIMLFGHGGYANRGCEAIVRCTSQMLHKEFKNAQIDVASYYPENDRLLDMPYVNNYIPHGISPRRLTFQWLKGIYYNRILHNTLLFQQVMQESVIKHGKKMDLCLSIGGDNYCYSTPYSLYAINRAINKFGPKLVLWGASVEPSKIDTQMKNDLSRFNLKIVRESITYAGLMDKGLQSNLFLHPDPAFIMEKVELPLPNGWQENNTIGLNVSSLILDFEKKKGNIFSTINALIRHIINITDSTIALIPHVNTPGNEDTSVLQSLYEIHKDTHRVIMLYPNYTANELKGFISRCRLFIGARTHATIAAYSSCVPTLVIGYSVKSIGIARDIFGSEQGMVFPVQELENERQLCYAFEELLEREKELRNHLGFLMPEYIKSAGDAVKKIRMMID